MAVSLPAPPTRPMTGAETGRRRGTTSAGPAPRSDDSKRPCGGHSLYNVQVSWVLTAFFIGYTLFQMVGGRLAEMFGCKKVFGYSNAGAAQLLCRWSAMLALSVQEWRSWPS